MHLGDRAQRMLDSVGDWPGDDARPATPEPPQPRIDISRRVTMRRGAYPATNEEHRQAGCPSRAHAIAEPLSVPDHRARAQLQLPAEMRSERSVILAKEPGLHAEHLYIGRENRAA